MSAVCEITLAENRSVLYLMSTSIFRMYQYFMRITDCIKRGGFYSTYLLLFMVPYYIAFSKNLFHLNFVNSLFAAPVVARLD